LPANGVIVKFEAHENRTAFRRSKQRSAAMKLWKHIAFRVVSACALWMVLPLALFDFTQTAVPRNEEFFGTQSVAIGPLPRPWFARFIAVDFDFPGGYGYDADGWAFVVWKPLCLWYVKRNGYAPPAEWR